ncbi:alpha/beta hydrolase [Lacticaseibacillus zhaodongensis]|uniref:alpha/beta hydrolase n=1 Tax=Lacticaseibacillus zhaodongensis TaxID=2668065 RepID=UPI0012D2D92B|nr:alpha/beta hydrolase [Lacticaseibacillus zhaodongensis]
MLNSLRAGNYANLYLDLAQSAYIGQPLSFPDLIADHPVRIDYSKARKHHRKQHLRLGRKGDPVVYLQPDTAGTNVGADGFQAFVVTPVADIKGATEAYFVVQGSQSMNPSSPDWSSNNIPFAIDRSTPAQTVSALLAWRAAVKAQPQIQTWNFSGHSLGTMVIASMLAKITVQERRLLGHTVLFNGPDISLTLTAPEIAQLQGITLDGKLHYYVSSRDMISAYHREHDRGIGDVDYIAAPTDRQRHPSIAAHAFDQYIVARDGQIELNNSSENIRYGRTLAHVVDHVFRDVGSGKQIVSDRFAQINRSVKPILTRKTAVPKVNLTDQSQSAPGGKK